MDKIILSREDMIYLNKWTDENPKLLQFNLCPLKSIAIHTPEYGFVLKCSRETNSEIRININAKGLSYGKIVLLPASNGEDDAKFYVKKGKKAKTIKDEFILGMGSLYFQVMAFLVHGNRTMRLEDVCEDVDEPVTDDKPTTSTVTAQTKKKPQKPDKVGVTYILRPDKNGSRHLGVRGKSVRHAKSWGVRGHYRHYKSGKVVWIAQHIKGDGKKKNKKYKVGKVPENKEDLK